MDKHQKGVIAGLISGATWGLDGVIVGLLLALAPFSGHPSALAGPIAAAALHDGISAIVLLFLMLCTKKYLKQPGVKLSKPVMIVAAAALLGGPVGMTAYVVAIMRAGPSYALPVAATYPVFGAVAAAIFLREKLTLKTCAGIAVSVTGAAIVGWSGGAAHAGDFRSGIAFAVVAAVCWGAEGVIASAGMREVQPRVAVLIRQFTSFFAYALIVFPLTFAYPVAISALRNGRAIMLAAAAGLCGAVSMHAWYRAINFAGVSTAMPLNLTFALWAVVFGALLGTGDITPRLAAGAILVAAGAWIVVSSKKPEPAAG